MFNSRSGNFWYESADVSQFSHDPPMDRSLWSELSQDSFVVVDGIDPSQWQQSLRLDSWESWKSSRA